MCGARFEQSKSQESRNGNKYCSKLCVDRMLAGFKYIQLSEWAENLLFESIKRAKRKSIEHSIQPSDMQEIVKRSGLRCEVSGIQFEFEQITRKGPHRPFSPSLDRIDSSKGYTKENTRLVCLAVNIAMNTWGFSVLEKISHGIVNGVSQTDGYIPRNRRKNGLLPGTYITSSSKLGTRYGARYKNKWIGYFGNEIDAHVAYKAYKQQQIEIKKASKIV